MPIPKPRDDESQDEFIERCMGDDVMNEEYPDRDQRYAICMTRWRDRNKSQEANMERKNFTGVQLKADKPGQFIARIATLNVVDSDGDVTLPGAFPDGKSILVSAYQHGSWNGGLPVGKAVIQEKGNEVLIEGEFNLNTETGKEHYNTIKFAPELQEWSYGFKAIEHSFEQREGKDVRLLKKLDVFEASPVLKGAGVGTAVLAIKNDSKGQTFSDEAESALAAVTSLVERAKSLADLRRKEGKNLSDTSKEKIIKLKTEIDSLLEQLNPVADVKSQLKPDDNLKGRQALLELMKFRNKL